MIIECLLARKLGKKKHYRINDTINNLTMGMFSQIIEIIFGLSFFFAYVWFYENCRFFNLESSWYVWVLCFLGYDFLYYAFHYFGHKVSIVWGSHEPHHSSEEFNYSVALRQGAFQKFFSFSFYFPLAILGFHPITWVICKQINTIYQFLPHTRLIGKMWRPIEFLFSTPSHHRVHHAKNPEYLDKNFGGVFIIWDRIFGTFEEEKEEPAYGIIRPLESWNPFWGQVKNWVLLFRKCKSTNGLFNKVKVVFLGPSWSPSGPTHPPEVDHSYVKYDGGVKSVKKNIYLIASYLFCMNIFLSFEILTNTTTEKTLIITYIVFSLINVGLLFENGPWAKKLEVTRIAFCSSVGLIYAFFFLKSNVITAIILLTGISFSALFFRLFDNKIQ
jgi:sterol desaturase/sphingolipid hydroxylase (fatty acid hydroxylase superfamily)